MAKLILFNKPYGVLSQFTEGKNTDAKNTGNKNTNNRTTAGDTTKTSRTTLAEYITEKDVYAAGRLDQDSEGLLLLTDNGPLQHLISHPHKKQAKTYWVQVEGIPDQTALQQLRKGVVLKDGLTKPAEAKLIAEPSLWPRNPPVRKRKLIPTHWLELTISEGKNRQVRRMTAAVGFPTLRLVRVKIGEWKLDVLQPGQSRQLTVDAPPAKSNSRRAQNRHTHKQRGHFNSSSHSKPKTQR